jgi:hypothetical protein
LWDLIKSVVYWGCPVVLAACAALVGWLRNAPGWQVWGAFAAITAIAIAILPERWAASKTKGQRTRHNKRALLIASSCIVVGGFLFSLAHGPDFKLSMLGGNVFIPDEHKDWTGIALRTRIRNAGTPSMATDWRLEIRLPDGRSIHPQLTSIPTNLTVRSNLVIARASDSLDIMTFKSPITPETPVEGDLLFYAEVPQQQIMNSNTLFLLSVTDLKGKEFRSRQRMGDWLSSRIQQP